MKTCAVVFGLLLIGCGGDGATGGGSVTAFLGTWSTPSATTTYSSCANPPSTMTASVSFTVSANGSSGISTNISNCPLSFNVNASGDIATLTGIQQCGSETIMIGSTVIMTAKTVTSGTLTLSAGSLVYSGSGTVTTTNNGVGQTCNFVETGTFTK